jgi:hypothetical protein
MEPLAAEIERVALRLDGPEAPAGRARPDHRYIDLGRQPHHRYKRHRLPSLRHKPK